MKLTLVLLTVGLCALISASSVPATSTHKFKVADKKFLTKQKDVLTLLKHINQPSYYKEFLDIAKSFKIIEHEQMWTKPEIVKEFWQLYQWGMLPKGEVFSIMYDEHLEQAVLLFKLFYYAKDYETFYKTAVWARQHVNEGMFLYSFSVAVVHRPDLYGIILPPIYEIYPYYFYNSEVIHKAQYYKQIYHGQTVDSKHTGYPGYTIDANYTGTYLNLHPEQSLSYFTEDVGINSFYYYYNLYYPFWMSGEEFGFTNDNRGELFYFTYQQILARYYLERLSNGFGEIPLFNWETPLETSYYPALQYPNGLEFPARPAFAKLYEYFFNYGQSTSWWSKFPFSYTYVKDYERRIDDAIDFGYIYSADGKKVDLYTKEGFNLLGNLIMSSPDSLNTKYFGPYLKFARHLLGYSYTPLDKYKVAPSALEHFETSMRDPMFYQLFKKVIFAFQRYQSHLPAYTEKELIFPGVKVVDVEFDRLITYFDYFYSDLSNAVWHSEVELEQDNFKVQAQQERLNHKPFTYKIKVQSEKATKATVKVFLGPKYDEYGRFINISDNYMNFVIFDQFVTDFVAGENLINRHSMQSPFFGVDKTSYPDLYKPVMMAYKGQKEFHIDGQQSWFYFPHRYMLPKGDYAGMPYQFYVIVYPYVPYPDQKVSENIYYYPKVGTGGQYVDGYSFGYPFDRFIKYEQLWYDIPNMYFYDTKIYHRDFSQIDGTFFEQKH